MKTAKQWIDESNWSDELKELFWERAGSDDEEYLKEAEYPSLYATVFWGVVWGSTPEGLEFWGDVANGKRTDIDRVQNIDQEYETLMWVLRKLLEGLKGEELSSGNDAFTRGYNTGIREMNEKIDEAIKKLEI